MEPIKKRSELDQKDQWDLTPIFKDEKAFLEAYHQLEELLNGFPKADGFAKDPNALRDRMEEVEQLERKFDLLSVYSNSKKDEDTSDNHMQDLAEQVSKLGVKMGEVTSYLDPTILKESYETIQSYYQVTPDLQKYDPYFKELFRFQDHYLNEESELLLSKVRRMTGYVSETSFLLRDSDLDFGKIHKDGNEIELTDTNYSILLMDQDRSVRKETFIQMYQVLKQFKNVFANTLAGAVEEANTMRLIRNYSSNLEAALFSEEIDPAVYDQLVDTVRSSLPVLYDYFAFKKEVLGYEDFHLYDTAVELVPQFKRTYTFEEAKELVLEVLQVLGDDYLGHVKQAFEERWIDVYPNKGKRSGAYSGGSYDTNPYMLLNFKGELDDVSTLIHEMGHSMHSYYTIHNNPYVTGSYKIFVAEVASTVNELLLSHYLYEHSKDSREQMYLLNQRLDLYKATFYRQTMFAEFEEKIYHDAEQGTILTSDYLCATYYQLVKDYFGPSVVIDEEIQYEWERIPHFFYYFYVYKYATGITAATYIVKRILNKEEHAVEDYIKFLSLGESMSPLESLKVAGVDLTQKEVILSVVEEFQSSLDQFKELYQK